MAELPEIVSLLQRARYAESGPESGLLNPWVQGAGFCGLQAPRDRYQYNRQVHGVEIIRAEPGRQSGQEPADGIWTREPGLAVAVRTADCLPVLFAAKDRSMVMAVHAGWRGLTSGILTTAVRTFAQQGFAPEQLVAAIGPAISRECYEVGPEVVTALYSNACGLTEQAAGLCIAKGRTDRWHVDLQCAAVLSLAEQGMPPEQIEVLRVCTFKSADYNSYRREGRVVASNISWISL
jgi:hypothetical protein